MLKIKLQHHACLFLDVKTMSFAADGTFNGLFTANLLQVWKDGSFTGNYIKFHKAIQDRMPQSQSPNYFIAGQNDPRFQAQQPFTI